MSTINPKDVKSLRDVRTLLNEVDNKLIESQEVILSLVLKIQINASKLTQDCADVAALSEDILKTSEAIRNHLYEDNRTL